MIVLDINVLSELMKSKPEENVLRWVANQSGTSLFTTTISEAEIYYGLRLLPQSERRSLLEDAAKAVFEIDFEGRVLSFDSDAAHYYSIVAVERRQAGKPISQLDAQIAGIVRSRRGTLLATRNVSDFEGCGIKILNPWLMQPVG